MTARKTFAIGLIASALTLGAISLPAMAADHTGCPMSAANGAMPSPNGPMKDGPVSKQDFLSMHASRFDQMDANKDGLLSREEMAAFHKAMKDCRGERHGKKGDHPRDGMKRGPAPAPQVLPDRNEP